MEKKFRPSKNYLFRFSKAELENIKRIFDYFDDGCDGSISIDDFPSALRACGLLLNNAEMDDIVYEADPNKTGSVTMSTFFIVIARKFRDAGEIEKTTEIAFNKIYTATDASAEKKIPLSTVFRSAVIARGGEPLTEALIDDFLRQIPPTLIDRENQIKINDLISIVMADLPPIENNGKSTNEETEETKAEETTGVETAPATDEKPGEEAKPKRSFFSFLSRKKPATEEKPTDEKSADEKG